MSYFSEVSPLVCTARVEDAIRECEGVVLLEPLSLPDLVFVGSFLSD